MAPTIYPYVCVKDYYNRTTDAEPVVRQGQEGYVLEQRVQQNFPRARISINGKDGSFLVTVRNDNGTYINISKIPAGKFSTRGLAPVTGGVASLRHQGSLMDTIFTGFFDGIREQMPTNVSEELAGRLRTVTACTTIKNKLLAGMPPKLLALLNSNHITGPELVKLSIDEAVYEEDSACIYARLYSHTNGQPQFYCGETLAPRKRHRDHRRDIKTKKGYHYRNAYGYTKCKILTLSKVSADKSELLIGEQMFHMLFKSYAYEVLRPKSIETTSLDDLEQAKDQAAATYNQNRVDAVAFDSISSSVLKAVNYRGTCETMGFKPLNWLSPMTQVVPGGRSGRVLWIKTVLSDRMQFRRAPVKVTKSVHSSFRFVCLKAF